MSSGGRGPADAETLLDAADPPLPDGAPADNPTSDGLTPDLATGLDAPLSPLAAACVADGDCATGACVDGVCCETACAALCEACNVTGSVAFGVPVPGGQDPDNDCSPEATGGCGNDGMCSGSRSCRKFAAGTVWEVASCMLARATSVRLCDGQGACQAAIATSCGSYACNATGTMCLASCTVNENCSGGTSCASGLCGTLLGNGALCASGSQCSSGTCADGVCCNRACAGTCEACNVASSVGTCAAVVDGQDPKGQCLHHYIEWADAAGRSKMGSYTGDGSDGRSLLGLGFAPEVVFVQCVANPTQDLSFKPRSSGATLHQSFVATNFASVMNVIQQFNADGFEVGSAKAANPAGGVCGYAAFAR